MARIKGRLLDLDPYTITGNKSITVTINKMSGLKSGDEVYEEVTDDGIVLLIPKKIYIKTLKEGLNIK